MIIGRILYNGDPSLTVNLNPTDQIIVEVLDTSVSDAPARVVAHSQSSGVSSLPTTYQITTTSNIESSPSYSMSVRILCPNTICYINDVAIPLNIEKGGVSSIDIPVRDIR